MTAPKLIPVDDIDNAQNLLHLVGKYLGHDSTTYAECKRLLSEGFTAKEVADAVLNAAGNWP